MLNSAPSALAEDSTKAQRQGIEWENPAPISWQCTKLSLCVQRGRWPPGRFLATALVNKRRFQNEILVLKRLVLV